MQHIIMICCDISRFKPARPLVQPARATTAPQGTGRCSRRARRIVGPTLSAVRHLVPRAAIQKPAGESLSDAAPLLEEEGHLRGHALVADGAHPGGVERSGSGAALAAHD